MSVISFPIIGLLLNICLAIVMSGCAANKLTVIPVVELSPEHAAGHQVFNCRSTQRDLTTPWSLRQYWCGEENRKNDLQNTNNILMDQVAANHSAADQAYIEGINNPAVVLPAQTNEAHVWHVFVIRCEQRETLQAYLTEQGIQTLIHYPIPPHQQQAYKNNQAWSNLSYPITESIHNEVLSLPISPVMTDEQIAKVVAACNRF